MSTKSVNKIGLDNDDAFYYGGGGVPVAVAGKFISEMPV